MFSPLDILERWNWDKFPKDMKPYIADLVTIIKGDDEEAKEKLWVTICAYTGVFEAVKSQLEQCEKCPNQPLDGEEGCHSC